MLEWISKLYFGLFHRQRNYENEVQETHGKCPFGFSSSSILSVTELSQVQAEPVKESATIESKYPELDKALYKFDVKKDILVIPKEYEESMDETSKSSLLEKVGDKIIIFPKGYLSKNNIVTVTAGYGW
jgi:hypothetical protein